MNDKAKQKRNEYMKQWRARNKYKVKAAQDRYWQRKASEREGEENICQKKQCSL